MQHVNARNPHLSTLLQELGGAFEQPQCCLLAQHLQACVTREVCCLHVIQAELKAEICGHTVGNKHMRSIRLVLNTHSVISVFEGHCTDRIQAVRHTTARTSTIITIISAQVRS